jgi:hypothetical protein
MAKKGPVDRFHQDWSPEHQAKVLQRLGITSGEFESSSRGKQRRLIRRSQTKAQTQQAATQQKNQQLNDPAYFTQPLTTNTANTLADQMTALKYGTAESQLQTRQSQVAPWFQNYQAQIGQAQQAQAAQNAPIIANAQAQAQGTGQTVLKDVDPNSDAAHNDALAAAARQALGNAFATQLGAGQQAANTYFATQQGVVAPQYQQSVTQDLGNQASQLAQEKGAYRATAISDLRDKAHTQNLETAAFGLDQTNTLQDNANAAAQIKQTAKTAQQKAKADANAVITSGPFAGYTKKEVRGLSDSQKASLRQATRRGTGTKSGLTPAQQRAAREKAGKAIQRVTDVKGEFNRLRIQTDTVEEKVKLPDGSIKKAPDGTPITRTKTIKPTREQVIQQLRKSGYTPAEIQLGLKVRANQPLTPADITVAKRLGIWPVPKSWTVAGKQTGAAAYPTTGSMYGPK